MVILLLMIFIIFIYCLWRFFLKQKLKHLNAPEKIKLQKIFKIANKHKKIAAAEYQIREKKSETTNEEDIALFDNVAKLMFEKEIKNKELDFANQIQYEFLNKMPTQASSQINQFDLEEWSIYWSYKSQSLEYYAGKYGIFYTHVDGQGVEHKMEFKCST